MKRCSHVGCAEQAVEKGVCRSHFRQLAVRRDWRSAESAIRMWLHQMGVDTEPTPYVCPFDLITSSGIRIESKWSPIHYRAGTACWSFNLHRHGKMSEEHVDFYVLRCEGNQLIGIAKPFYLVIPSPIGVSTLDITITKLITRYAKNFNAARLISSRVRAIEVTA